MASAILKFLIFILIVLLSTLLTFWSVYNIFWYNLLPGTSTDVNLILTLVTNSFIIFEGTSFKTKTPLASLINSQVNVFLFPLEPMLGLIS